MAAAARAVKEAVEAGESAREIRKMIQSFGLNYFQKRGNVDTLLRMSAVNDLNQNLKQERREMADWYNRTNRILDGRNGKELEPVDLEDDQMMVAGDVNVHVSDDQPASPAPQPVAPVSAPTLGNGLKQTIAGTVVGAGLMAGGFGLGSLNDNPPVQPPPQRIEQPQQFEDTDTIGILEPDRE